MSNKTAYEKLHRATREGNKNLVTAVLATEEGRRNIDAVNYRGVSALMLAICVFHANWTLSPRQTGQSERSDAGGAFLLLN